MKITIRALTVMLLALFLAACPGEGVDTWETPPPKRPEPIAQPHPGPTDPGLSGTVTGSGTPGKPGSDPGAQQPSTTPNDTTNNNSEDKTSPTPENQTPPTIPAFNTPLTINPMGSKQWGVMLSTMGKTDDFPAEATATETCKNYQDSECKSLCWYNAAKKTCKLNKECEAKNYSANFLATAYSISKHLADSDFITACNADKKLPTDQPEAKKTFFVTFGEKVNPINDIASYGGDGGSEWGKAKSVCGDNNNTDHFITGIEATGEGFVSYGFGDSEWFLDNLRFLCKPVGDLSTSVSVKGDWIRQLAKEVFFKGSVTPLAKNGFFILTGFYGWADQYKNSTVLTLIYFVFRPVGEKGIDYKSPPTFVLVNPPSSKTGFIIEKSLDSDDLQPLQPVLCPQGAAVDNLFGNAGEVIDRLGITCRQVIVK